MKTTERIDRVLTNFATETNAINYIPNIDWTQWVEQDDATLIRLVDDCENFYWACQHPVQKYATHLRIYRDGIKYLLLYLLNEYKVELRVNDYLSELAQLQQKLN
jgi:hypothetical protein